MVLLYVIIKATSILTKSSINFLGSLPQDFKVVNFVTDFHKLPGTSVMLNIVPILSSSNM